MPEEIQKFDPSTLADRLKDRIKNSIADLIPEEQWKSMMKNELHKFFNETTESQQYGYSTKVVPSTFTQVFREVFTEIAKKQISEYMSGPEFQPVWKNGTQDPSAMVSKLVRENADVLVEAMFANAMQNLISGLRASIQNGTFR